MSKHLSPKVSIIIRTYNESLFISDLLKTIKLQTYANTEIILVDSESTDNTVDIAKPFCDKIVNIKKKDFTFGYSLNKGIEQSTGDYLILVSAHTLPCDTTWIQSLIEPLNKSNIAMVYGKQIGDHNSRYPEFLDMLRIFPDHKKILQAPQYFSHNANSSLKKDLWELHNFNPSLSGQEDIEWAKYWMEKGMNVYYQPNAPIIHSHRESWVQIHNRFRRESLAMKNLNLLNLKSIPSLLCSELRNLCSDIYQLSKNSAKNFQDPKKDIFLYRYHKIAGTIHGLFQ